MYAITFKGKVATLGQIYQAEAKHPHYSISCAELETCIVSRLKSDAIAMFLHHIGFTWKERTKGIEVQKVEVAI